MSSPHPDRLSDLPAPEPAEPSFTSPRPDYRVDRSGFRFFSDGDAGAAHALAHRLLDEGREAEGLELLGVWLAGRSPEDAGSKSEWVHLQWHLAVFEIAAGRLEQAHERFREHVLPAVERGEAATDGPSLLWRLWLAGGEELELEWGPVRDAAIRALPECEDPYVALHHLLALAGARDVVAIDRWLDGRYERVCAESCERDGFLLQMAWALRTFANRDYEPCAKLLESVHRVALLGGSRAQNELFEYLRRRACQRNGQRAA